MKVQCHHCGQIIVIQGLGRKPFDMPVTKVYDALRFCQSVPATAEKLGCSRAYIYKVLKANGLTPADVIKGLATKSNTLLNIEG